MERLRFLCEGGEQCAEISKEYAWRDMRRILDDLGKEAVMDDVSGPMVTGYFHTVVSCHSGSAPSLA